jgi:hypothetical protein
MVEFKQHRFMRRGSRKFETFASGFFEEKPRGETTKPITEHLNKLNAQHNE